jgi:hypothetical protein
MDAAGGGSIRSLPSIMSPKSLLGRSSARVGIANEFTQLPTSVTQREVPQAVRLQASSSDDANNTDQLPIKRLDSQKRVWLSLVRAYACNRRRVLIVVQQAGSAGPALLLLPHILFHMDIYCHCCAGSFVVLLPC